MQAGPGCNNANSAVSRCRQSDLPGTPRRIRATSAGTVRGATWGDAAHVVLTSQEHHGKHVGGWLLVWEQGGGRDCEDSSWSTHLKHMEKYSLNWSEINSAVTRRRRRDLQDSVRTVQLWRARRTQVSEVFIVSVALQLHLLPSGTEVEAVPGWLCLYLWQSSNHRSSIEHLPSRHPPDYYQVYKQLVWFLS